MNRKLKVSLTGILAVIIGVFLSLPRIMNYVGTMLSGYDAVYGVLNGFLTIIGLMLVFIGLFIISAGLKRLTFVLSALIIFLFIFTVGAAYSYNRTIASAADDTVTEVRIDPSTADAVTVEIPMGSDTKAIAKILEDNGVIKKPQIFTIVSKLNGFDGKYQAGTHVVKKGLELDTLMKILIGKPESQKVTVPEGLTYKQVVKLLAKKDISTEVKLDNAMKKGKYDFDFVKQLQNVSINREFVLEGYLFPDTYEFARNPDATTVIQRMLGNFNSKVTKEHYKRAKELGMTMDQVITLASIIEREASTSAERRLVSAVFQKRLKSNDVNLRKLQSCATLQYIFLNQEGKVHEQLTYNDTKIDNAYNTYIHPGLPPGPICSPGMDSINAALYPDEDTDYMFFIAKGDGTTKFSKTYSEHVKAMKQYGLLK
jgi:UPF0755 protein